MTKKIFKSILIVAGTVLLASIVIIMGCLYEYFSNIQKDKLADELDIAASAVELYGTDYLKNIDSERYRITWIQADGKVIYDTQAGADSMENHADRQEVKRALAEGEGSSSRYSDTLMEKTSYYARLLDDGSVLRVSTTYATAGLLVLGMLQPILVVLIAALVLSGILARRISKRIVEPMNSIDLDRPLENDTYEELSPLLNRINQQHREIEMQMRYLKQRTDEFTQITESMKEGLILLDNKGNVLSINEAAQNILETDSDCIGQSFLSIERSRNINNAIQSAFEEGHSEIYAQYGSREYQVDISRIESGGETVGAVLLAFDITEQQNAQRNRREFTANVSHELKTPLQGIIGSAELIENGMVKPEDMPRFIGHIRKEASRLVTLIEDIIRLSQLDEGRQMPSEQVDLFELADEVKSVLEGACEAKHINMKLMGEHVCVDGVKRLLYEIIYNLCDNAVKYNNEGGIADIDISSDEKNAYITVRDSGIGIPQDQQQRVFERFYRVDKSHSKESGGTGLGLSIVKHAVSYHNGTVSMKSEPGNGTEIRVSIPLSK
ncbi:MAG: ATP-binding protein [Anaerovoracaceae bacterium]|nr:ATP-binding protein [Anaerovoracaceae bacterium]